MQTVARASHGLIVNTGYNLDSALPFPEHDTIAQCGWELTGPVVKARFAKPLHVS